MVLSKPPARPYRESLMNAPVRGECLEIVMNRNNLFGGLRIVMQALAGKIGIGLTFSGQTAFTDHKCINLPVLDHVDDAGVADLARGYIDHEAAHIRFTDPVPMSPWLNILEDVRIEKAMVAEFPGSERNLRKLVARIKEKDDTAFLGVESQPVSVLQSWALCWGRSQVLKQDLADYAARMEAAAGRLFGERFCHAFMGILEKLPGCGSTGDCRKLVDEIEELLRENPPPPLESQSDKQSDDDRLDSDGQSPGENQENDQEAGQDSGQSQDRDNEQGDARNKQDSGNSDGDGDPAESQERQGQSESDVQSDQDDVARRFDIGRIMQDSLNSIANDNPATEDEPEPANEYDSDSDRADENIEYLVSKKMARQSISEEVIAAKRMTAQLRAGLTGLLEAVRLRPVRRAPNGHRIAGSSIHLIGCPTPDMRVFRSRQEKRETNASVVILLDTSSSMRGNRIRVARSCTFAISEALDSISGIETQVANFPASWCSDDELQKDGVRVIKRFGKKPKPIDFGVPALGNTPICQAMLWGGMQLCNRPQDSRKILLVLTDGDLNDWQLLHARKIVSRLGKAGVEVFAIGIIDSVVDAWIPAGHGKNISEIKELPAAMISLLKGALLDR